MNAIPGRGAKVTLNGETGRHGTVIAAVSQCGDTTVQVHWHDDHSTTWHPWSSGTIAAAD